MSLTHYCATAAAIAMDLETQLDAAIRALPDEGRAELAEIVPTVRRLRELTAREPADPDFDPPILAAIASVAQATTKTNPNDATPTTTIQLVARLDPRQLARLAHTYGVQLQVELYAADQRAVILHTPEGPTLELS